MAIHRPRRGLEPILPYQTVATHVVCVPERTWAQERSGLRWAVCRCVWVWFQRGGRETGRGRFSGDGIMWGAVVRVKRSFPGDGLRCRGRASQVDSRELLWVGEQNAGVLTGLLILSVPPSPTFLSILLLTAHSTKSSRSSPWPGPFSSCHFLRTVIFIPL